MSPQDRELFYYKLLEASVYTDTADLGKLFQQDLLQNSAELNWIFEKAIKNKDAKIINFLLSLDLETGPLNPSKQTGLHLAVYHDYLEVIERLFEHCSNASNAADVNGLTHFHVACIGGNLAMARRFLLGGVDADLRYRPLVPDASSNFGALHFAVKYARTAVVELLLRHGADPNARDALEATPLLLVCRGYGPDADELDIARLLLDHGADVNARDALGDGPLLSLFRAAQPPHPRTLTASRRSFTRERRALQRDKLSLLLERGANPGAANHLAETALHLVIGDLAPSRLSPDVHFDDAPSAEMVRLLLDNGADPDARTNAGESPLQMAIGLLSYEIVRILLEYGADANCTRFVNEDRSCFRYCPDLLPCLEATENLIGIIEALASTKFHLSPKDNLTVLKFLVTNNVHCQYADIEDENAYYKLQNLLELGAGANIQSALTTFPVRVDDTTYSEQMMRKQVILQIREHLNTLAAGGIYVSEEVRECLQLKVVSLENCLMRCLAEPHRQQQPGLEAELQLIKRTMVGERVSLYDVVRANPRASYPRIRNSDYRAVLLAADFPSSFPRCAGVIKGHVTKCLVSRYVTESARDALASLLDPRSLPDLCCEMILGYLNNESLLDLCTAATYLDSEASLWSGS